MGARYPLRNAEGYEIDIARERFDVDFVYRYLSEESYWARGLSRERFLRGLANSYCFGLYAPMREQIGFAKVTTDYARVANLGDVFIVRAHRGRGLSKWLIETILSDEKLEGVIWRLNTYDAHTLYERYGFKRVTSGDLMERLPDHSA
jgi:GNAT superfamily N-acetyltransferase